MIRYLISLAIFLGGVLFATTLNGISVIVLVDIPSFILVGILPFLFIGILYGFKETAHAFSMPFKKGNTKDDLTKAFVFFQNYGKTIWLTCLVSVIIAVISLLVNLEDKSTLGPNAAVILLSLLYSAFINVLVVIPFTVFLKKQLKE